MPITSLGIGSGVDLNSLVTQLVAVERQPLRGLQSAASRLQTQVSSYGKLQSLFGALQDASNKLTRSLLAANVVPLAKVWLPASCCTLTA